jgi:SAM-dependent methyltransferase
MGARLSKGKTSAGPSMKQVAKTYKANGGGTAQRRGVPKTARATGRRGLHDLLTIYNGLSGYNANTIGMANFKTTYGEVAEQGIHTLSEKFRSITPLDRLPAAGRNFYDLGSGIGRLVVGIALLNPSIKATGIEIVPDRARQAREAYQRIRHKPLANRVELHQGSFLDTAFDYKNAAWVFVSNLCLDEQTQRELLERLERQLPVGAAVICSKELVLSVNSPLEKVGGRFTVPMTWSSESQCSAYRVKATR